jgi:hypothetical protein
MACRFKLSKNKRLGPGLEYDPDSPHVQWLRKRNVAVRSDDEFFKWTLVEIADIGSVDAALQFRSGFLVNHSLESW